MNFWVLLLFYYVKQYSTFTHEFKSNFDEMDEELEILDAEINHVIYDGTELEEGQLPYLVHVFSVYTHNEFKIGSTCAGTLLSTEWIISAAHCISRKGIGFPDTVIITAGTADISMHSDGMQRHFGQYLAHPDEYDLHAIGKADISLIKLHLPFHLSEYVQFISIASEPWNIGEKKEHCVMAGWGITENKMSPYHAKMIEIKAGRTNETCVCQNEQQMEDIVCLERKLNAGLCNGDSGSGLVCDGILQGIAHAIIECYSSAKTVINKNKLKCGDYSVYGICIYIYPHKEWIEQVLNHDGGFTNNYPLSTALERGQNFNKATKLSLAISSIINFIFCTFYQWIYS